MTPGAVFDDRTFDAVLFDMDGTLISSIEAVDRSWSLWAGEHGFDPETFQIPHGTPARAIVDGLLPSDEVDAAVARIAAIELADTAGVVVLDGVRELLASLPPTRFAIVTSCTRDLAVTRLAATGLEQPLVVVTADDVTHGKPDPEPFLLGASRLGIDPARCLVVEDAPAGLAAARAAGCATLAVDGTHERAELDADAHARGLADVQIIATPDGSLVVLDAPAPADPEGSVSAGSSAGSSAASGIREG